MTPKNEQEPSRPNSPNPCKPEVPKAADAPNRASPARGRCCALSSGAAPAPAAEARRRADVLRPGDIVRLRGLRPGSRRYRASQLPPPLASHPYARALAPPQLDLSLTAVASPAVYAPVSYTHLTLPTICSV